MAQLDAKSFDEPDELLELPLLESRIVTLGEVHVAWTVVQPGWLADAGEHELKGLPGRRRLFRVTA